MNIPRASLSPLLLAVLQAAVAKGTYMPRTYTNRTNAMQLVSRGLLVDSEKRPGGYEPTSEGVARLDFILGNKERV